VKQGYFIEDVLDGEERPGGHHYRCLRRRTWLALRFYALATGPPVRPVLEVAAMSHRFTIGDHVIWNSEAGHVSGHIIAIHTNDFVYKGYVHHATEDDPQYEIRSETTDHIAVHKGGVLKPAR
jgi:hypothetical protein